MKKKMPFILICLLTSAILVACGPSQAELDAQATKIAADIVATQTAEAPTLTYTPTPTDTPTNTPTFTLTPTDSPTPTDTPTPTPMPVPPTPTPVPPTPTLTPVSPIPTATPVEASMWCDVWCWLEGPAGDPASRNPKTGFDAVVQGRNAVRNVAQIVVEPPSEEIVVPPPFGDIPYGWEGRFFGMTQGLPQAGGTYTFIALDADDKPISGAVCSDVYFGGYEPDPPANVQAEVVEAGILVTWDPSRVIPGVFEPNRSPPLGSYVIYLIRKEGELVYGWGPGDRPLLEMSHLIPFRRQDFGQDDAGLALEEIEDGVYYLRMDTFTVAPEETAGPAIECYAHDPAENIWIVIEGSQVRVEAP
jgi:hypothetical protein